MKAKKRTLDEIRQTKDSIYKAPHQLLEAENDPFFKEYLDHMQEENCIDKVSIHNFSIYLSKKGYKITKK